MTTPTATQRALIALGKKLVREQQLGTLSDPPTLVSIVADYGIRDPRVAKRLLLEGITQIVGKEQSSDGFDAIFKKGKAHPSAEKLRNVGSELGSQRLAGKRDGWQSLESIMAEYGVEKRPIAKRYLLEGLTRVLGPENAKTAYSRIFSRVLEAEAIRQKGRELAKQWKAGTLHNTPTLLDQTKQFGLTNTGTMRKFLIEGMTEILGDAESRACFGELFPHSLKHEVAEAIRQEGRKFATKWRAGTLTEVPTLTSFIRKYGVRGRDVVGRYFLEGMREILDEQAALKAYAEFFSQKKNLEIPLKENLHIKGRELAEQWKQGIRGPWQTLVSLMEDKGIRDPRTAKNHLFASMRQILGQADAEKAWKDIFGKMHEDAAEIRQRGQEIARQYQKETLTEHIPLREIAQEFGVSKGTGSKYVFEGITLEVGEKNTKQLFQKLYPHDVRGLVGAYNHSILEAGLKEVIGSCASENAHGIIVKTEKLEVKVKHDVLIEGIQKGEWFRQQLARLTPKSDLFATALKLPEEVAAKYTRISIDFTTRDEPGRVDLKNKKYADEHTLLIIAITGYAKALRYRVQAPAEYPNVRIMSAELAFQLFGGKTPAIELVQKVRDFTRQGKVDALKIWERKVTQDTAPSFVKEQKHLDQWLPEKKEALPPRRESALTETTTNEAKAGENSGRERTEAPAEKKGENVEVPT